jgi:hypothetical protein
MTIMNASIDPLGYRTQSEIFNELDSTIESAIYKKGWYNRIARGYDALGEQKGRCAETAAVVSSFAATVLMGSILFCSVWGAYEMYKDVFIALGDGERPPANIGHAGEWTAEAIIYTYFYVRQLHKVAAEGDYHKVNKIFLKTFQTETIDSSHFPKVYHYILQTTKKLTQGCLIPRSLFNNTINSINLMSTCDSIKDEELAEEVNHFERLKEIFEDVQKDLNRVLSTKNFFRRSWEGIKSVHKSHGKIGILAATVTGVVLPVILTFQSISSLFGTGFLIDDLANNGADISVIGHIGEWPVNFIGFNYFAYQLNVWSITSEGDLVLAKEVIQSHLNEHGDELEESLRNIFIRTGNGELENLASKCMFTSVPSSYLLKESDA